MIWVSRTGSIDAMKILLDAGADGNLPGSTGDNWDATPLQHAILERQPAAVSILLERGADLAGVPGRVAWRRSSWGRRRRSNHP